MIDFPFSNALVTFFFKKKVKNEECCTNRQRLCAGYNHMNSDLMLCHGVLDSVSIPNLDWIYVHYYLYFLNSLVTYTSRWFT